MRTSFGEQSIGCSESNVQTQVISRRLLAFLNVPDMPSSHQPTINFLWPALPDPLNITGSRASPVLNDLKLHLDPWPDGAITLPGESGKVKEHIFA
jgi:hypothetical protein